MNGSLDPRLRFDLCVYYGVNPNCPTSACYFNPPWVFGHGFYKEQFDKTLEAMPGLHHSQFGSVPPPHDADNTFDRWRAGKNGTENAWRQEMKDMHLNEYGSMLCNNIAY